MNALVEEIANGEAYSLDNFRSQIKCSCGGSHSEDEHWKYVSDMPSDPIALADDYLRMGLYKPEAIALGENLTKAEMMEALLIQNTAGDDPLRRQLCEELIKEAGGLDAALSAAFGVNADEFLGTTLNRGEFSRRRFLKQITMAAGLLSLGFSTQAALTQQDLQAQGSLEKSKLRIGFIPITCATPILMSKPLGFYKKYGLEVDLVKMPSWAAVRDSAIAGELDAYHMLTPMPIALSIGLGSATFPVRLASIENIHGQSIVLANKHKDKVKSAKDFKGLSIGIPFPFSNHNLLMRYYLAAGGLNPDKDVQLQVIPPPDALAKMTSGQLDAFLLPDNVGQRAVFNKVGFIHLLTKELWTGHPCCAFAASQAWISTNPNTFRAVNKAIIDGCGYSRNAINRSVIAKAIAPREYLNAPEPVIKAVLTGNFEDGQGNTFNIKDRVDFDPYPWKSFAYWINSQLVRWNLLPAQKARYEAIANQVFLDDIARTLAKEVGQKPPSAELRTEKLKYDTFDPKKASAYIVDQKKKYGV
ncbi:ABC-type nitrate/sulfonate/bicarbonate transport system, periplasmic component [Synechococcus sp. PCC 7502]|uniref:CmpA/NrtA family ABC transporter substrate-binding protein n=1 Tax=Synechococcus sp. PCC 7502 TaxID=1173263 RepID=UPI00029FBE94|nr:CmpA/NrtA family ABC transporter substrate-binding protein [Synechococcus sp. PCC 7502]AFY73796.1 ABC-type nitrate/sulfonate/bicarbonate transport system, periplasmic component [Synechococcus sp. PCC 7502]